MAAGRGWTGRGKAAISCPIHRKAQTHKESRATMPQISIGVPVHNGADLLAESLECLLGQSFGDFNIVVSDNASTDGSDEIAKDFARRDPRISVIQQPENIGAVGNFLATLEVARAPFFMWRAHDDLSDANYLEALHQRLRDCPGAMLAVGTIASADLDGGKPRRREPPAVADDGSFADGLRLLFTAHPSWYYGLWRTDYLKEAFPRVLSAYPHAWAHDHLLLFPVLLRRAVVGAGDTVFRQRLRRTRQDRPPRRRAARSPQLLIAQRRQFRQACLDELAGMNELSAAERGLAGALLPLYVNKRVHRPSKVLRALVNRILER
jgi:glycosyltransferase involved in cell wall biosynthesis